MYEKSLEDYYRFTYTSLYVYIIPLRSFPSQQLELTQENPLFIIKRDICFR